jgi:ubiquinone/menaquinone biosynthesis C-methylase UbiE
LLWSLLLAASSMLRPAFSSTSVFTHRRGRLPIPVSMSRMSQPSTTEHVYGRSPEEHARLTLQARILRPYTERFFRAAGLVPGMRVLDIGSGIGDVAMLAAEIVGPNGRVVGIDKDPSFLEHARRRAEENGCAPWVTFEQAEVDAFTASDRFDALVGRYILLYLRDPAATLARLLQSVKPGGIVVCHEVDLTDPHPSYPPCPLWDQGYKLVSEAFTCAGAPVTFGRKFGSAFLRAGLPFPTIVSEGTVGGGPGSHMYPWLAATVKSLAPRLAELRLSLPRELEPLETLAARLEQEAIRLGSQVMASIQFGAWARKPL